MGDSGGARGVVRVVRAMDVVVRGRRWGGLFWLTRAGMGDKGVREGEGL
jgi:hypothetical protein